MTQRIAIHGEGDLPGALLELRCLATVCSFDAVGITQLATVLSELVSNILKYAGSGTLVLRIIRKKGQKGIELCAVDQGPGIPDIEQALQDHFSSGGTLGLGLPGIRRLVNEFSIESTPGVGTRVTIRHWA